VHDFRRTPSERPFRTGFTTWRATKRGSVSAKSHDTPEFAVASIRQLVKSMGRRAYPMPTRCLSPRMRAEATVPFPRLEA